MLKERYQQFLFDADGGDGGGGADSDKTAEGDKTATQDGDGKKSTDQQYENFGAYLEKQPKEVQELYKQDVHGLKSALTTERDEKKSLAAQLKELLPKAEKGSELENQLTETVSKLESAERRAAFAESAIRPEIGCSNVKAAYALALADDLFDKTGSPNWEDIKKAAPELFRKPGSTDGGAGNTSQLRDDLVTATKRAAGLI
jgi:hypothetical protein